MIGVVRITKTGIVVLKVGKGNFSISGVEMVYHITSGCFTVANVFVSQRTDKNFVDGQK